jgi:hypothetical protein
MRLHHVNVVVPPGRTDNVVAFYTDVLGLRRVAAVGAPWEHQPPVFGGRRGFTRDPEGNRIELLERAGDLA